MTTYVPESQKGRAIAAFWVIFNLGGGVGSLASFGLNYDSKTGTVSNATYIALLIIMAVGWSLGLLICPPSYVRSAQLQMTTESEKKWRHIARQSLNTICDWRVLCMFAALLPCQRVLFISTKCCKWHEFQYPHAFPEWCIVLDRTNAQRSRYGDDP